MVKRSESDAAVVPQHRNNIGEGYITAAMPVYSITIKLFVYGLCHMQKTRNDIIPDNEKTERSSSKQPSLIWQCLKKALENADPRLSVFVHGLSDTCTSHINAKQLQLADYQML